MKKANLLVIVADIVVLVAPGAVGLLLEAVGVLEVNVLHGLPLVLDTGELIDLTR